MAVRKHYIIIGRERYGYTIKPARQVTYLVCRSANIEGHFPNDEVPRVLAKLPALIAEHRNLLESKQQTEVVRFRVSKEERARIEENAFREGYETISAYLRDVALRRNRNGR